MAVLLAEFFLGALVYAGDIVLLSPTASGMRTMLHVCDKCCKCLCFKARHISASYYKNPPSFLIGGDAIEFVSSRPHLGHNIDYRYE